jgi:hypothetical protein
MPDELDARIRSLQAERLRPVPPSGPTRRRPVEADLPAIAEAARDHNRIRRRKRPPPSDEHDDHETPGPSASSETTRKDRADGP